MKAKTILLFLMGTILICLGLLFVILVIPHYSTIETGLKPLLFLAVGFFFVLGLVIIGLGIYEIAFKNKLDAEGIFTEGEIVKCRKNDGVTFAYIRFFDESGNEQFFEDCFYSGLRRPGDKVMLSYTIKKNGKVLAQCLDRG